VNIDLSLCCLPVRLDRCVSRSRGTFLDQPCTNHWSAVCRIFRYVKEEKRIERVDGKAAGDYGFITCQRIGLADGARADAIPNAAGGEGGHGAAKPHKSRYL
jgi:hypothetical protein